MKKFSFFMIVLATLCITGGAHSANWYMATNGSDGNSCSSSTSPCATLQGAFGKMSGGDTLYLANGTYTGSGNLINQNNQPPNGSAGNYTTIRATKPPPANAGGFKPNGWRARAG